MLKMTSDANEARNRSELNEAQQRRFYVTCSYIDKLLVEIEQVLHETASPSPFLRHIADIAPARARGFEEHIRRLREQLLLTLEWQRMKPEPPEIPATRSVLTHLEFIDNAIEELKPKYMRGSGAVPNAAVDELEGVIQALRLIVRGMQCFIRQE